VENYLTDCRAAKLIMVALPELDGLREGLLVSAALWYTVSAE